jgi:hypothetical protein
VSIDFTKLPTKELLLLEALMGMGMQYTPIGFVRTSVDQALSYYGLCDPITKGNNTPEVCQRNSDLWGAVNQVQPESQPLKIDFDLIEGNIDNLTSISVYLLIALAGFADQALKPYEDQGDIDSLYHDHFSAGEGAFVELQKYGLMITAENWCGYWTKRGHAAVEMASQLGEFPPAEHLGQALLRKAL